MATFSQFGGTGARTDHIQKTAWSSRWTLSYTLSYNQYYDLQNIWRAECMYVTTQQQINGIRVERYSCIHLVNLVSRPVKFMHRSHSNLLKREVRNVKSCDLSTPCAKYALAQHNK